MHKLILLILIQSHVYLLNAQEVGIYAFARTPQIVNYQLNQPEVSYSQGISVGIGLSHRAKFLEVGTFIFEANNYGYYSFFGSVLKTSKLGAIAKLNTNWFGEVTHLPIQAENRKASWSYTGGLSVFPNVQLQQVNIGVPLSLGLAYHHKRISLNSRFILNLSYQF